MSRLTLGLAAAVVTPFLLLGISGWSAWEAARRSTAAELSRTAEAAAEFAQRLFEAQLLRIERAGDLLAGLPDTEIRAREAELHAELRRIADRRRQPDDPVAYYLFVYDRHSLPLVASTLMPVPSGRPARDRDFARILSAPGGPAAYLSPLHLGRDSGRHFFSVTARRERTGNGLPPGTYDGAIAASVYPDTINPALRSLAAAPGDVVTLLRADGAILARSTGFGGAAEASPRENAGSPLAAAVARGEERGIIHDSGGAGGAERAVAFRRAGAGWPVIATAERDRATVAAAWLRELAPQAALAGASSLLLLLLARAVIRRQRDLRLANASLERRVAERTLALRERERLLRLAQQASDAGSWSWEPGSGVVTWSPEIFDLLGLDPLRDAGTASFEGFLALVHPSDRERLAQAVEAAVSSGTMSAEYRVSRRTADGTREERWFLTRARLFPAEGNHAATLVGIDVDITERRRAEERFEAATAAMEGFVYDWDMASGHVARTAGVVMLLGEEVSPDAAAWFARIHPEDRERAEAEFQACLAVPARERFVLEYRVRRADGSWAWIWDRGRIFRDPATGLASRTLGGSVDITARRRAEERQRLLMREVDHRGKNALAVVKAALRLTRAEDAVAYRQAIEGRIEALARAQSLLAETGWAGSDLRRLLEGALEPFLGPVSAPQAVLEGLAVELSAAATQPLSMAFHELATNATKYGALSVPDGVLRIAWWTDATTLHLRWEETGGPEAAPPRRKGFGSRVVDATMRGQLGGGAEWHWQPSGLLVEIALPLPRVLAQHGGSEEAEPDRGLG